MSIAEDGSGTKNESNYDDKSIDRLVEKLSPTVPMERRAGTNAKLSHENNQRVILEIVRSNEPLSRVEISSYTSLSKQTVNNIVDLLLEKQILLIGERRSGRRGQPAVEIEINPGGGYSVGLHLDRDHMAAVLLDLKGNLLQISREEWSFPTPGEAVPKLIKVAETLCLLQGLSVGDLWGVGLALPGPLDVQSGSMLAPPNFAGWDQYPIRDVLWHSFSVPVFLETDATAAAVGERWFGNGRTMSDFFYIFFGVGVGGGIVLNGKPYRGSFNTAAMFGHIPVQSGGPPCVCGGQGCLELYISLASLYDAIGLTSQLPPTSRAAQIAYENHDPAIEKWLGTATQMLVPALVTLENLLNLEAIVFGGRFPEAILEDLLSRVERQLPQHHMKSLQHHPTLMRAGTGEDAAALGAATIPLFEALTPVSM